MLQKIVHSPIPKNNLGTLEEIEKRADKASLELRNQKGNQDGVPDRDPNQVLNAEYHSEFDDYLDQEKPGD